MKPTTERGEGGAEVPGRAHGPWSPGGRPQLLPGASHQPAQHADTSPETQLGALHVSPPLLTSSGCRRPQDHGQRPRGSPGGSGSCSQWDCGSWRRPHGQQPPIPGGDAALQGALSPWVRFRGTTFQTALEGRVGSGTESRTRKWPL